MPRYPQVQAGKAFFVFKLEFNVFNLPNTKLFMNVDYQVGLIFDARKDEIETKFQHLTQHLLVSHFSMKQQ